MRFKSYFSHIQISFNQLFFLKSISFGGNEFICGLYKNGSVFRRLGNGLMQTTAGLSVFNDCALVYLNGSTDYLAFTAYSSIGSQSLQYTNGTYFTVELIGVSGAANVAFNQANNAASFANGAFVTANSSDSSFNSFIVFSFNRLINEFNPLGMYVFIPECMSCLIILAACSK